MIGISSLGDLGDLGAVIKINDPLYVSGRTWLKVQEDDTSSGTARGAVLELVVLGRTEKQFGLPQVNQAVAAAQARSPAFRLSDVSLSNSGVQFGWRSNGRGSYEAVVTQGPSQAVGMSSEKWVDAPPTASDYHDLPNIVQIVRITARPVDGVLTTAKKAQIVDALGKAGDPLIDIIEHSKFDASGRVAQNVYTYTWGYGTATIKRVDAPKSNVGLWLLLVGTVGLAAAKMAGASKAPVAAAAGVKAAAKLVR